jgi:AraC family transcriptional regulator of adaptative response / DNA-3-methyladenine glycosylase II
VLERAVAARDPRFDGRFWVGVTSTRIYCRPSCPAMTPRPEHMRFFPSPAAAQEAGLRACLRCRPDAAPGSPEWDARADLAGRAMRLIADGVVDREGVGGLARRLAVSERHLHRTLVGALGAGPVALARARRAQAARLLAETTGLPLAQVAFAAGFSSVRQFNDTVRRVYGRTPGELRRTRRAAAAAPGVLALRLAARPPLDAAALVAFIGARAIPGVEEGEPGAIRRTLRLPRAWGVAELRPGPDGAACTLRLGDLRDLGSAVERCRRLLDLDADPLAVAEALGADPLLAPLVAAAPGLRVPGGVDGFEVAARAVLGQQVSVAAARTLAGRLASALGEEVPAGGGLTRLFPGPDAVADADLRALGLPRARAGALAALAAAAAAGGVDLDPGADREATERALLALPGIGPWTAAYVRMRALADPDAFLPTDLGLRRALAARGVTDAPARAERWRPWRAYALMHLWQAPG